MICVANTRDACNENKTSVTIGVMKEGKIRSRTAKIRNTHQRTSTLPVHFAPLACPNKGLGKAAGDAGDSGRVVAETFLDICAQYLTLETGLTSNESMVVMIAKIANIVESMREGSVTPISGAPNGVQGASSPFSHLLRVSPSLHCTGKSSQ